jgi:nucleoside-diphosphate-sugar epimerase
MTLLVTGAAGFIGSKVVEFLLGEGCTVVGIDNLSDAYDVRLKQWRLEQLEGKPGFEFHRLNICDRDALHSLFIGESQMRRNRPKRPEEPNNPSLPFDAIINLAARAGVRQSIENPWVYFDTNVTGTLNLLELCKEFNVKKFVLASTSSLYGSPNAASKPEGKQASRCESVQASLLPDLQAPNQPNQPNRPEGRDRLNELNRLDRPFSESDPTDHPLSPYAASKKAAEALCYTYHYLYGIDVTVLRYFTVYGPAGRPDMSLFRFVQWISEGCPVTVYGDGRQSRDFTYVGDIAKGTVAALRPVGYEVVNLGSDKPVVLIDAIRLIERLVDRNARIEFKPRHPADVMATWANISKADRLLSWRPQTKFEEGVTRLVEWYRENREWAKEIRTD